LSTNNNDSLLRAIQNLLEQQRQNLANMHHGMLHQIYQQLEAFITINKLLEIRHPLPPMRGWAASPDFLVLILGEILARKPNLVVELGSGVSTLISAYALEKLGKGKLISVDHDSEFLQKTHQQINLHGLHDVVQAVHAPLTKITLNGIDWQWYDLASVEITSPVEFLVVDGPPGDLQARSRYPALPLFAEHLSDDAALFLDDVVRPDEQAIVREWVMQYSDFSYELVNCEKGAAIFRRTSVL
jgi:hypothetical protein